MSLSHVGGRRILWALGGALIGGALVWLGAPWIAGSGVAAGWGCLACKKWLLGLGGAAAGSGAAAAGSSGWGPGGSGSGGPGGGGSGDGGSGPGGSRKEPDDGLFTDLGTDLAVDVAGEALTHSRGNPVGPLGSTTVGTITTVMGGVEAANKGIAAIKSTGGRGLGGASQGAKSSMDAAMKEILNR